MGARILDRFHPDTRVRAPRDREIQQPDLGLVALPEFIVKFSPERMLLVTFAVVDCVLVCGNDTAVWPQRYATERQSFASEDTFHGGVPVRT